MWTPTRANGTTAALASPRQAFTNQVETNSKAKRCEMAAIAIAILLLHAVSFGYGGKAGW